MKRKKVFSNLSTAAQSQILLHQTLYSNNIVCLL